MHAWQLSGGYLDVLPGASLLSRWQRLRHWQSETTRSKGKEIKCHVALCCFSYLTPPALLTDLRRVVVWVVPAHYSRPGRTAIRLVDDSDPKIREAGSATVAAIANSSR